MIVLFTSAKLTNVLEFIEQDLIENIQPSISIPAGHCKLQWPLIKDWKRGDIITIDVTGGFIVRNTGRVKRLYEYYGDNFHLQQDNDLHFYDHLFLLGIDKSPDGTTRIGLTCCHPLAKKVYLDVICAIFMCCPQMTRYIWLAGLMNDENAWILDELNRRGVDFEVGDILGGLTGTTAIDMVVNRYLTTAPYRPDFEARASTMHVTPCSDRNNGIGTNNQNSYFRYDRPTPDEQNYDRVQPFTVISTNYIESKTPHILELPSRDDEQPSPTITRLSRAGRASIKVPIELRRGGPPKMSQLEKRKVVEEWFRVQETMTQEAYARQIGLSSRHLRRLIQEITRDMEY